MRKNLLVLLASIPLSLVVFVFSLRGCINSSQEMRFKPTGPSYDKITVDTSPDGETIVYSSTMGDLYLYSLQTKHKIRLTNTPVWEAFPAFSPDGKYLTFTQYSLSGDQSHIYIRSLDGKLDLPLTTGQDICDTVPQFSPDGSQIVFVRSHRQKDAFLGSDWTDQDIWVVNRDGTNLKRITQGHYYSIYTPVFLDKNTILFSEPSLDHNQVINVVPGTGGNCHTWFVSSHSSEPVNLGDLAVSVDGKHIAFIGDCKQPFDYDINLIDIPDGSNHSLKLTTSANSLGIITATTYNKAPVFAKDSKSVLYLGADPDDSDRHIFSLWRVDIATKKTAKIAASSFFNENVL